MNIYLKRMVRVLWIALVFVTIVAVTAIAYVVMPLFQPSTPLRAEEDDQLAELIERKDETLRSIKEVEFDYHTGKLSEEDFERDDQRLRRQAIGLIRQIEVRSPDLTELDASLESTIESRRQVADPVVANGTAPATQAVKLASAPIAAPIAASVAADNRVFCHQCGAQARPDDKFCAKCGTELRNE